MEAYTLPELITLKTLVKIKATEWKGRFLLEGTIVYTEYIALMSYPWGQSS